MLQLLYLCGVYILAALYLLLRLFIFVFSPLSLHRSVRSNIPRSAEALSNTAHDSCLLIRSDAWTHIEAQKFDTVFCNIQENNFKSVFSIQEKK